MEDIKYGHKKKKFSSACNISDERFNEISEKVGLVGFLAQQRSEALEIIQKDDNITAEEKPVAYYLMGALLEKVRK